MKVGSIVLCIYTFNPRRWGPDSPVAGKTYTVTSIGDGCGCEWRIQLKGVTSLWNGGNCLHCFSKRGNSSLGWAKIKFIEISPPVLFETTTSQLEKQL